MDVNKRPQPNEKLRREREKRGWSQQRLANQIDTTTDMVGRWERETSKASPFYQEKLCLLFGKNAEELGFIERENEAPDSPRQVENIDQDKSQNFDFLHSSSLLTDNQAITLKRGERELSTNLSPHIFLDSALLDRLERAFNSSSKLDHAMLEYLNLLVFGQKKQLVQGGGTNWHELLTTASNHLRLFINFLESDSENRQLITFIGETCLLIGDVLFNSRDYQAATRYYSMSLRAAQEASNTTLRAIALGRYSLLLIDVQQSLQALLFIDEAIRLAEPNTSSLISSWLWAVKGEAHAHIGEEKLCLDALEASRVHLGWNKEKETCYTFVGTLAPSVYGTPKLLGYEGACYLHLRQPEQAQHVLNVSRGSSSHPHHQSLVSTDFAMAFIQQNLPQEACVFAAQALTYIQQTHSIRAFQRVLSVRQALNPWNGHSEIRDLDEQIVLSRQLL